MALEPIPNYLRSSWQTFGSGLNTKESPLRLKGDELAELIDMEVNKRGLIETGKGYVIDGSPFPSTSDSFIRMLARYRKGAAGVDKLVVAALDAANTHVTYKVDLKETNGNGSYDYIGHFVGTAVFTNGSPTVAGVGTAWNLHLKAGDKIKATGGTTWYTISAVDAGGTQLTLSSNFAQATTTTTYKVRILLDLAFIPSAVSFNDKLIISNGSDAMMTYNNSTLNKITSATAPKAAYLVNHKNRVFALSTTAQPSYIYWSAVNDESTWDANAYEPLFPQDNGIISGATSFGDSLVVFKNNGNMYQVVGNFDDSAIGSPAYIKRIDTPTNMGAVYGYTATVHDDGRLWFLTETGFYALDQRMILEKLSSRIDPTTQALDLSSVVTNNKSFPTITAAEFTASGYSQTGCKMSPSGGFSNFADTYAITDAVQGNYLAAMCMDSSYNLHVAYVKAGTVDQVRYAKISAIDGTITYENVFTAPKKRNYNNGPTYGYAADDTAANPVGGVCIAVNAAADRVAIGIKYDGEARTTYGSVLHYNGATLYEKVSGSWAQVGNSVLSGGKTLTTVAGSCAVLYTTAGNDLDFLYSSYYGGTLDRMYFIRRRTATITYPSVPQTGFGGTQVGDVFTAWRRSDDYVITAGYVTGTDNYYQTALVIASTVLEAKLAATTFTANDSIIASGDSNDCKAMFSCGGALYTNSWPAGTVATTVAGTDNILRGSAWNVEKANYFYLSGTSGTTEKYVFENSNTLTESTASRQNPTYKVGGNPTMVQNSVFGFVSFGANANEILLRRFSYRVVYTSPIYTDNTLDLWSTYQTIENEGSNSINHEVALNSANPPTVYVPVLPGSVIPGGTNDDFVRFRVTGIASALSSMSVTSVIMNYTAAGVNGKIPTAVLYNNEYYCAVAKSGDTSNTKILSNDRGGAWREISHPVTFFQRFGNKLYAGSALKGDVYILQQGYKHNTTSYTSSVITKEDLLGSLELEKDIYKAYVMYEIKNSGSFTLSYRLDNFKDPSGNAPWINTTVNATSDGRAEIHIGNKATSIQFKCSAVSGDNAMGILGFVVMYHMLNAR